jgi:ABC-type transporter Mla maintaining outer membrane lipid asymmetry ATPase subunit MlaF
MAESDSPLIEMLDVEVTAAIAPDVVLIERVNWTVSAGDYWIIGGLPGSGKTDLLSTAAGLVRVQRGAQRFFGREIAEMSEEELVRVRLRVGLVFANEGRLFNHLTVAENLALPICYHQNCPPGEAEERVQAILEFTGLSHLADNTPGTISRSIRPRVGLARALVLDPQVLLLDEPLNGRDPREMRWWLECLAALRAGHVIMNGRRMTIAVTVANLRPWLDHGEKFALINDKQWLLLGGRAEVGAHDEPLLRELL